MSEQIITGAPQGTPVSGIAPEVAVLLAHADDNMVMAQRLGDWISNAPELELDIALGNIALDHLGVARALYSRAGDVEGVGRNEDDFAMKRTERQFTNLLLVEQPNGDFAHTVVRQLFFDVYQRLLWAQLAGSEDTEVAGIAERAGKEAEYHYRFSSGWLVRLGDGTEESHLRTQDAVDALWRFTSELFAGPAEIGRPAWDTTIGGLFEEASLSIPEDPYQRTGGRQGFHTEHLGFLLAEMQWMPRTYPGLEW